MAEQTMKLFSITLTAWRIEDEQPLVAMRTLVVLLSEADIEREYKLTSHEIRAALDYYSENQKQIDDAIRVEDARITAVHQRVSSRVRRGSGG